MQTLMSDFGPDQNEWNRMAAQQWAARQGNYRADAEEDEMRQLALGAARNYGARGPEIPRDQWIARQPYARDWLPAERNQFQEMAFGESPEQERARMMKEAALRASQTRQTVDPLKAYQNAFGKLPFDMVRYNDPKTGISTFPGKPYRNPDWDESSGPEVQQFLYSPGETFSGPVVDQAWQLMKPYGYNRPAVGAQQPNGEIAQIIAEINALKNRDKQQSAPMSPASEPGLPSIESGPMRFSPMSPMRRMDRGFEAMWDWWNRDNPRAVTPYSEFADPQMGGAY